MVPSNIVFVPTIVGGTAPYTYSWAIKGSNGSINGVLEPDQAPITLFTPPNAAVAQVAVDLTPGIKSQGLLTLRVTDANGKIAQAQYWVSYAPIGV